MADNDPAAGGGPDPTEKTGGSGVPAGGGLTEESIAEMISTGVKAGMDTINQNLDATVTGAAKRHFDKMIGSEEYKASMSETITAALKTAAVPPPAEPTEIQSLTKSLSALDGALKVETLKREEAEGKVVESTRITAIGDMLKGQNIDPNHAVNFRTLVAEGHLDGLKSRPSIVDGQLVYTTADGATQPAETKIADYLKTNSHWLSRFTAAGGGAPGSNPNAAPLDADHVVDVSSKGSKKMAAAMKTNPEAALKALDAHVAERAKDIPGWT